MFNSTIQSWINYYGRYYKSALNPTLRCLDRRLVMWATRKYKRLRNHRRRATYWLDRIAKNSRICLLIEDYCTHRLNDRSRMSGDVHVRFCESLRGRFPRATRHVCCFQYLSDLEKFMRVMDKRLRKFHLELSEEKTRAIRFTSFKPKGGKSFVFLGFEFRWGLSRKMKPLVKMRTAKTKFRLALAAITKCIKLERYASDMVDIMDSFSAKLPGHFNYYGVSGNNDMLSSFYHHACHIVFKWLNRRSQRKSYSLHGFDELLKKFRVPRSLIIGYWS